MHNDGADDRSPLAIGYAWSIIITSIGMEMTLPALLGLWLDRKCGTLVLFTFLGGILGMTTGIVHLVRIGKGGKQGNKRELDE